MGLDLRSTGLQDLVDVIWFGESLLAILLLLALIASLQRLGPNPPVLAPVLGAAWWAHGVYRMFHDRLQSPEPFTVDAVFTGAILAQLLMLWLAVSLILHRKTRSFLNAST
ncbi:MAG: hypothetical protein HOW73_42510 [Polyangiaceae bacterium]|nr:hypothetical protein [Polyangiaceae bacterium]